MNNHQAIRTWYIVGNWKMNHGVRETTQFFSKWSQQKPSSSNGIVGVIAPPFVSISTMQQLATTYPLQIASQDISAYDTGAYTGECSGSMLKEIGCQFVIVGHSERRLYHKESNELLSKKIKQVYYQKMCPIFCVGETLQQREKKQHFDVISKQLDLVYHYLEEPLDCPFLIAYEPIWAIGSGKTASFSDAQEIHKYIRNEIEIRVSKERSIQISILYGGSVKPNNAVELMKQDDIDGLLIGGSSLNPDHFYHIFDNVSNLRKH